MLPGLLGLLSVSPGYSLPDQRSLPVTLRIIDKTLAAVGEGPTDASAPVDRTSRWQGPPAEGTGSRLGRGRALRRRCARLQRPRRRLRPVGAAD